MRGEGLFSAGTRRKLETLAHVAKRDQLLNGANSEEEGRNTMRCANQREKNEAVIQNHRGFGPLGSN